VAHYRVWYQGRGEHPDRDAYWSRVRVEVDGRYLGAWLGVVDGRTVATLPAGTLAIDFNNQAVLATAEKIRDRAQHGELRSEWKIGVEELPLLAEEIMKVSLEPPYDEGDTVLEFDTST
jgi:hypothetical protein